jgi:DNA-binding transcriptional regulator YiaG
VTKHVEKLEWFRVVEEFEASGLTQREFAERRSMSLGTLQSWVYRRRRQAPRAEAVRLLPVQVAAAPSVSGAMLEVVSVGGARVRFAAGTDVEYVARLVAALSR